LPVVDVHTHVWPDDVAPRAIGALTDDARPVPHYDGTPAGLLKLMDTSGVDVAVLQPVATRASQVVSINTFTASQASPRLVPFGAMHPEFEEPEAEIEVEVKVCRGCGDQMPLICPTCNAKTTSYCGTCRATRATRRASGEPQILSSGLRKLTRGELEHLVLDVIRTHALPDHLGITGWTPARVGIYLPGRSTGAISNVLDKLAATGQAQLLGTDPKRYQPVPGHDEPDGETDEQPGEALRSGIEIDSEQ